MVSDQSTAVALPLFLAEKEACGQNFVMTLFTIHLSQLYGNIWDNLEQKSSISL